MILPTQRATSYSIVIDAVAAIVLAVAVTSDSGTSAVFSWCFTFCQHFVVIFCRIISAIVGDGTDSGQISG